MSGKPEGTEKERQYYSVIRDKLDHLLRPTVDDLLLEITADKGLTRKLKSHVRRDREIIFVFLKQARPDITGCMTKDSSTDFVVVEVKKDPIKLDDIYQVRKYRDLFEARVALLVSLQPVPDEIRRLAQATFWLMDTPSIYHVFALAHFDQQETEFAEWYPKGPSEWRLHR